MTKRQPGSTRKRRSDYGKGKFPTSGQGLVTWINSLHTHKEIKQFYMSSAWERVRDAALMRDHFECQRCKKKGLYVPATVVHHKKYLRDRPDLALNIDNLESLCSECHYKEHHPDYKKYIDKTGKKSREASNQTDDKTHKSSQWRWFGQYYEPKKVGKIKAKRRQKWDDDPFSDSLSDSKKDDPL